jgi:hypothetical protein
MSNAPQITTFCATTADLARGRSSAPWPRHTLNEQPHSATARHITQRTTRQLQRWHQLRGKRRSSSRGSSSGSGGGLMMAACLHELDEFQLRLFGVLDVPKVVHDERHWHREEELQHKYLLFRHHKSDAAGRQACAGAGRLRPSSQRTCRSKAHIAVPQSHCQCFTAAHLTHRVPNRTSGSRGLHAAATVS